MKYSIISDSYFPRFEDHKDFHVLISDLSKEQVLSIINGYEKSLEISKLENKHPLEVYVELEGFDEHFNQFRGDVLSEMNNGRIIPMWDFSSFKKENI